MSPLRGNLGTPIKEVAPGLWHWTTFHEGIEARVSSYYVELPGGGAVVDPRVPDEGLGWFERGREPAHAFLTNRHHYRHSDEFERAFGTKVHAHRAGLFDLPEREIVPFEFGARLPGGVLAVELDHLCAEETAFWIPERHALVLGDSVVRRRGRGRLTFVPDDFMGPDPEGVRLGLRAALSHTLALEWRHLLLAHGEPIAHEGKDELERFMTGRRRREAA